MHNDIKAKLVESLIERALAYQKSGSCDKAALIYRGLLRHQYQSPRVYTNLGSIQYDAGMSEEGVRLFEMALQLDPTYQNAWQNLLVDAKLTNGDSIIRISEAFLSISANNLEAMVAQANGYVANEDYEQAKHLFGLILEINYGDLAVHEAIAKCYLTLGDLDSAVIHLFYILSIKPDDLFAVMNMSDIAATSGDNNSSISILETASKCNPEEYRFQLRIAQIYQSSGLLHKALATYELARNKAPDSASVLASMAYCFAEMGNISGFFQLYDQVLEDKTFFPDELTSLIFACSTLGEDYLDKLREYSQLYWETHRELSAKTGLVSRNQTPAFSSSPGQHAFVPSFGSVAKTRIGILTGDLGTHVVSSFLASYLLNYSKESFEVEVISNRWKNDSIAETLSASVDKCISIAGYGDNASRNVILSRDYDVIIETSGFTPGSGLHLLAERCALVQCHWIGYHASTYLPSIDYFIGDSVLIPDSHSAHFSESIVRLERAWLAATPFYHIPEATGKDDDEDVIVGAFSQTAKLTEATLQLWAKVLQSAPHSKLLLKDKFTNDLDMKRKIVKFFSRHSIDENRITFLGQTSSWFQHMALYNKLDLAMDTTPWSSATTAFDALSMGVPLVAFRGKTTSGTMSSSVVCHGGRPEWVADTQEEYVEKCLNIIDSVKTYRKRKRDFQS